MLSFSEFRILMKLEALKSTNCTHSKAICNFGTTVFWGVSPLIQYFRRHCLSPKQGHPQTFFQGGGAVNFFPGGAVNFQEVAAYFLEMFLSKLLCCAGIVILMCFGGKNITVS